MPTKKRENNNAIKKSCIQLFFFNKDIIYTKLSVISISLIS